MSQRVVILGASNNPERYSYKAFHMLREYGHQVILVSPKLTELEGEKVFSSLQEISGSVDTLTMYIGASISSSLEAEILALQPARVIFNPGSENPSLETALKKSGVEVLEACTLVMLRTNQF